MAFLELRQLTKRYGERTVVSAVDLTMERGEILSLLGPSGCGKTTILRMIAGLVRPDDGYIHVDDRVYFDHGRQIPTEDRHLGMVFQDLALWPHMTVAQNIAFGLRLRRQPAKLIAERVHDLLEMVNLPGFANRFPHQLSGGQQQRIAVARALATTPSIILLDEPLSSLDTNLRATMREELVRLFKRLNITAINVTHDQDEATMMSDRIMVLRDGLIQQLGSPTDLYLEPANAFVASFIGEANFVRGTVLEESGPSLVVRIDSAGAQNPFVARPTRDAQLRGDVAVMCRPDQVIVHQSEPPPSVRNVLCGKAEYTSFVAGRWRTLVRVDGHEPLLVYAAQCPPVGEAVWLELPFETCRVVPGVNSIMTR